jgi:hypothetical protein
MKTLALVTISLSLLAVLFVFSSDSILAEQPAKMTVIAVDKMGNAIEDAKVAVTVGKEMNTLTTDVNGKCLLETAGTLITSIEVTKGDCTERLAPVGILDGMIIVITLHCWPAG